MQEDNSKTNRSVPDLDSESGNAPEQDLIDQIQLLVDNELSSDRRTQLFAKLDDAAGGWKQCAIAFCNEQFLQQEFERLEQRTVEVAEKPGPNLKTNTIPRKPNRSIRSATAIAVGLLIGLGTGIYMGTNSIREDDSSVAIAEQASVRSMVQEAKDLVQENKAATTIPVDLPITRLFELENTDKRAVYLSPDPLPEFILQSMVFAGHDVEVAREHIETAITADRTMSIPIYELRVTKNQQYSQVVKSY